MEFLVTPAEGEVQRLLGLGLEERGTKMLAAAGLRPAGGPAGEGALALYPGERVGPGALGKEIAAIVPTDGEVVALSGGPEGPSGRPVLLVGGDLRRALEAQFARRARIELPARTWELAAETGSESFTVALPGWQTSSHISHSAAAEKSTVVPGLRLAGAVIVTGRNSSPS